MIHQLQFKILIQLKLSIKMLIHWIIQLYEFIYNRKIINNKILKIRINKIIQLIPHKLNKIWQRLKVILKMIQKY